MAAAAAEDAFLRPVDCGKVGSQFYKVRANRQVDVAVAGTFFLPYQLMLKIL